MICEHMLAARRDPASSPVNISLPGVPDAIPARRCIRTPATRANSADAIPADPAGTRNATLPGTVVATVHCALTGGIPDAVGAGAQLLALAVGAARASPAVPSCGAALTYAAGSAAAATAAAGVRLQQQLEEWQTARGRVVSALVDACIGYACMQRHCSRSKSETGCCYHLAVQCTLPDAANLRVRVLGTPWYWVCGVCYW
jgi:hypothetical protein